MNIKTGNALVLIGIVFLAGAVIGNLLYMNPFVANLYAQRAGHPGLKPWQEFGSLQAFIMMNMAAGVFLSILYVILFSLIRDRLPSSAFAAGLIFGLLVILVKAAPEAWNQYLNINYPPELILTQLVNSVIGILAMTVILSFAWLKWPAVV